MGVFETGTLAGVLDDDLGAFPAGFLSSFGSLSARFSSFGSGLTSAGFQADLFPSAAGVLSLTGDLGLTTLGFLGVVFGFWTSISSSSSESTSI